MFWLRGEEDGDRELGLGLVAGHGRPEDVAGGDDPQPHVWQRGDQAGRPSHRHWGRSGRYVQFISII